MVRHLQVQKGSLVLYKETESNIESWNLFVVSFVVTLCAGTVRVSLVIVHVLCTHGAIYFYSDVSDD